MPSVVLVHDDPDFAATVASALACAGFDVRSYLDTMSALNALEATQPVEILVTRVTFSGPQPNGVALARMAGLRQKGVKVLFVARVENLEHTASIGALLPMPASPGEVVAAVRRMLLTSQD